MAKTKAPRRRWTIVYPKSGQYMSDPTGDTNGIAWTDDLRLAKTLCRQGGMMVDADWLSNHWDVVKRTKAVPPEAQPPQPEAIASVSEKERRRT